MKALTIRQPWASLIAAGVKTIETRSWSTRYRGPLAIHAGKHKPGDGELGGWCYDERPWLDGCGWIAPIMERDSYTGDPIPEFFGNKMPLGAVVATCTLADVVLIGYGYPAIHDHQADTFGQLDHPRDPLGLWLCTHDDLDGYGESRCVEDQRPFGDFTPGRYAWLLTDVAPLAEPIPAKGRQGLWDWEA